MRRNPRRRRQVALLVAASLVACAAAISFTLLPSYASAVALVVRAAGLENDHPWIAAWGRQDFEESKLAIPTRHGPLESRLYRPERAITRPLLLVPGINGLGIEEPRLVFFARALARTGVPVVTSAMPDMTRYLVSSQTTDMIEDAASWLADGGVAPAGPIGLAGISFAGGLSVVAAGRPALCERVRFVFAFGGHASFTNVLEFLVTGIEPVPEGYPYHARPGVERVEGGIWRKPHDYGVAVVALALADRLVPLSQAEPLREAILRFLGASHLALHDEDAASRTFEEARQLAARLDEPARTIMREVNDRDVASLGARLLPLIGAIGRSPDLSPIESPSPSAPVYLLHAVEDDVIPTEETLLLRDHLEGKTETHVLLTSLMSHSQVDQSFELGEAWLVVSFLAGMLRE